MNLGYRGRLFFVSLVLTLLVVSVSGFYLNQSLREWVEDYAYTELVRHTRTTQVFMAQMHSTTQPMDRTQLHRLAGELGESTDLRVEFYSREGVLQGDSGQSFDEVGKVQPLTPTKLARWAENTEQDGQFTTTTRADAAASMAMVRAWRSGKTRQGFVRLSRPLSEIEALKSRVRLLLFLRAGLGLIVAILMSGLAAHLMSRTLRELIVQVQQMLQGAEDSVVLHHDTQDLERIQSPAIESMSSISQLAEELSARMEVLAEDRDRFRAVLESMSEGVLALDQQQHVKMMNRAAQKMFAPTLALFDDREMSLQHVTSFIRVPVFLDLLEDAARGKRSMAEFTLSGPPERQVVAHVNPRGSDGEGSVLVLHDVSELRKLERVRKDFVANVSHELRTPVSVIMLNAETLIGDDELIGTSPHARRFVEGIHRHAERLSRLISDLLDISRLEAGRFRLEREPISVFGAGVARDGLS